MPSNTQQVSRIDFFISYNSSDRHWAEWIAWQLEEVGGYTIMLQSWDIQPGFDYVQEIHEATIKAKRTIAVISPEYLDPIATQPGWTTAFLQHMQGKKGTLVPVLIHECELTGLLAPLVCIDLTGLDELQARQTLLESLRGVRRKPKSIPFPGSGGDARQEQSLSVTPDQVQQSFAERPSYPKGQQPIKKRIKIFYSYAHSDEPLRDALEKHLALLEQEGVIAGWHDRHILPGKDWENEISSHINSVQIILLLISSDFIASKYCYGIEMKRAMQRFEIGEARVIPVILRPVDWHAAPFGKLQALPKNGKAVTTWSNRDKAFVDIARGIRRVVDELVTEL